MVKACGFLKICGDGGTRSELKEFRTEEEEGGGGGRRREEEEEEEEGGGGEEIINVVIIKIKSRTRTLVNYQKLSALGTSYRELPKLVFVTLSLAKQFVMNCYRLVQQAALRFIMLLKPYRRNPVPWILCQPDYWKTILMTSCLL